MLSRFFTYLSICLIGALLILPQDNKLILVCFFSAGIISALIGIVLVRYNK